MIRRELSKYEFLDISEALDLSAASLRAQGNNVAAVKVDNLRKLFEDAYTGYLELEAKDE